MTFIQLNSPTSTHPALTIASSTQLDHPAQAIQLLPFASYRDSRGQPNSAAVMLSVTTKRDEEALEPAVIVIVLFVPIIRLCGVFIPHEEKVAC